MKNSRKILLAVALAAVGISTGAFAQKKDIVADTKVGEFPYHVSNDGTVHQDNSGACIRTGYWSKSLAQSAKIKGSDLPAGCFCDKDEMPKGACEPKKADAPKAAAPAPKPAAAAPKAAAPAPAAEKVTLPADTLFAFNSSELTDEGKERLESYAMSLAKMQLEVVIAVGHADRIGKDSYNQALSEKRAEAVKALLVANGIEANRVYTEGKGETQPKTGDDCKKMGADSGSNRKLVACLAPDRRVDLEAVGTFTPKK